MNSTDKRKATVRSKYGVDSVSQLEWVQEKRREAFESKRRTAIFYQEPRINKLDASELEMYRLNKDSADEWLNTYHLLGAPKGNILSLGLVRDNTIYCIMTFKRCRSKEYSFELSRLAMLPTYDIIGGYDLLSQYASDLGVHDVVAYVNLSFENYQDYESIGMIHVRDIQKKRWWMKDDFRISDDSRRQKGISVDSLLDAGYLPVYDCGQRVYAFK